MVSCAIFLDLGRVVIEQLCRPSQTCDCSLSGTRLGVPVSLWFRLKALYADATFINCILMYHLGGMRMPASPNLVATFNERFPKSEERMFDYSPPHPTDLGLSSFCAERRHPHSSPYHGGLHCQQDICRALL